jgi:hypothetical protein
MSINKHKPREKKQKIKNKTLRIVCTRKSIKLHHVNLMLIRFMSWHIILCLFSHVPKKGWYKIYLLYVTNVQSTLNSANVASFYLLIFHRKPPTAMLRWKFNFNPFHKLTFRERIFFSIRWINFTRKNNENEFSKWNSFQPKNRMIPNKVFFSTFIEPIFFLISEKRDFLWL